MFRKKSLESHHYYDEKIFTQEIEHIFKKEWLWVGRSDQLKNSVVNASRCSKIHPKTLKMYPTR